MSVSSATVTFPALADDHRRFLELQRIGYLATADAQGRPHVVPVCYAVSRNWIYITIDDKPKRTDSGSLKRLRNIAENPAVAFVADRYDDEDWSRLGWVVVRGIAEIIDTMWDGRCTENSLLTARRAVEMASGAVPSLQI